MSAKVNNKAQILEVLHNSAKQLNALGVKRIGLFGSFVSGSQTEDSDVDIFVEFFSAQHTFDNFMELAFLLEDQFGRRVELVTPESLSPYLGPHIMQEVEIVPFAA